MDEFPLDIYKRSQDRIYENSKRKYPNGSGRAVEMSAYAVINGLGGEGLACAYRKAKDDIDMLKSIHATEVADGEVPDMKETALDWADFVSSYIPEAQSKKLRSLIEAVPKKNTLLHGDYHTNNIMIQNGEAVLIDMDTLSVGHPIFEFGYMYNAFIGYSAANPLNVLGFLGYPIEVSTKFWRLSLEKYFDTKDQAFLDSVEEKAILVGTVRALRHAIRHPKEEFAEQKIAIYKQKIATLLEKVDTLTF